MKLSYVIASMRPDYVKTCLESIARLPDHEHETVVVTPYVKESSLNTPYEEANRSTVLFVLDEKFGGSTYAVNKGVQASTGDWILIGTDDHSVNFDVYGFLNLIQQPHIQSLEYQVINLGAPWTDCLIRNVNGYGIDPRIFPPETLNERWPVATFPAVSRKTIMEKLNGHIFHPDLVHHFVDHFLGLYISRKQPNYDLNQFGSRPAWTAHVAGDHCDRSRDGLDSVMFCKLAAQFLSNPTVNYTDPVK